jgi:hypothetical protein
MAMSLTGNSIQSDPMYMSGDPYGQRDDVTRSVRITGHYSEVEGLLGFAEAADLKAPVDAEPVLQPKELPQDAISKTSVLLTVPAREAYARVMHFLGRKQEQAHVIKSSEKKFSVKADVCVRTAGRLLCCRLKAKVFQTRQQDPSCASHLYLDVRRDLGDAIAFGHVFQQLSALVKVQPSEMEEKAVELPPQLPPVCEGSTQLPLQAHQAEFENASQMPLLKDMLERPASRRPSPYPPSFAWRAEAATALAELVERAERAKGEHGSAISTALQVAQQLETELRYLESNGPFQAAFPAKLLLGKMIAAR